MYLSKIQQLSVTMSYVYCPPHVESIPKCKGKGQKRNLPFEIGEIEEKKEKNQSLRMSERSELIKGAEQANE